MLLLESLLYKFYFALAKEIFALGDGSEYVDAGILEFFCDSLEKNGNVGLRRLLRLSLSDDRRPKI